MIFPQQVVVLQGRQIPPERKHDPLFALELDVFNGRLPCERPLFLVGTILADLFLEIKQRPNLKTVAKSGESSGSTALGTPLLDGICLRRTRANRASERRDTHFP